MSSYNIPMPQEEDFPGNEQTNLPEVITIAPRPLTPEESLISASGNILRSRLTSSQSLSDFILFYYATRVHFLSSWDYQDPIQWVERYGKSIPDKTADFFSNDEIKRDAERDAGVVEELGPPLQSLEDQPESIKMVLKRIRGPHRIYRYGVLTEFPRGIQAENPILGFTPVEQTYTNPDRIYFRPTTACVLNACDDLFKLHRQTAFYVPYRNRAEAMSRLQYNDQGVNEYILENTPEKRVKQEAENYILIGVHSAFKNEPWVAPVSRFREIE